MPIIEGAGKASWDGLGLGDAAWIAYEYDFAKDGGAVSQITLRGEKQIPNGAIILGAFVLVTTPPTSGGAATISLDSEAAGDLQAAAAFGGAPYSAAGAARASLTETTAPVVTTAARDVKATVAVAALTGGKFTVVVHYLEVEA